MPLLRALLQDLGVLLVVMGVYAWANHRLAEPEARAFAFTTLVIANLALILSNRSRSRSLLASLRAPNATLWIVTGLTLGFLALSLYVPGLPAYFASRPCRWPNWPSHSGWGWPAWSGSSSSKRLDLFQYPQCA